MSREFVLDCPSLEDTRRAGNALGRLARPGLVIGLIGELGAGKTTFTRAIAEGLGVLDPRIVTSPTFILVQEYLGRLPLYHFDTYRLKSPDEFMDLGVEEYLSGDGVCVIEWADRVSHYLPTPRIDIELVSLSSESRRIIARPVGEAYASLLESWLAGVAR